MVDMKMMIVFCQHILLTISEKIDCLAMKIWYTIQKVIWSADGETWHICLKHEKSSFGNGGTNTGWSSAEMSKLREEHYQHQGFAEG